MSSFLQRIQPLFVLLGQLVALNTANGLVLKDLTETTPHRIEKARNLKGARVVLADYPAIRNLLELPKSSSRSDIDRLLLDCCAYVVERQLDPKLIGEVNSLIPTKGEAFEVVRPLGYGKASVREVSIQGRPFLIDVKGTGGINPAKKGEQGGYATGLMPMREALLDYTFAKIVGAVLMHSKRKEQTLEYLAVIKLPFRVYDPNLDRKVTASILVREGHLRGGEYTNYGGTPYGEDEGDNRRLLELELAFRKYGLTSTSPAPKLDYFRNDKGEPQETTFAKLDIVWADLDAINIQRSRTGKLLDFTTYRIEKHFFVPLVIFKNIYKKKNMNMDEYLQKPRLYGAGDLLDPGLVYEYPNSTAKSLANSTNDDFYTYPDPKLKLRPGLHQDIIEPTFPDSYCKLFCRAMTSVATKLDLQPSKLSSISICL